MNNQQGMMTSLLAVGAAGAVIYGISRGMRKGKFKQMAHNISNMLNSQSVQQIVKPMLNMMGNTTMQKTLMSQTNQ